MIHIVFPAAGTYTGRVICPTGTSSAIVSRSWVSVSSDGGGTLAVYFQKASDSDGNPVGTANPWTGPYRNANRVWAEIPSGTDYLWYQITTGGPGALAVEQMAA